MGPTTALILAGGVAKGAFEAGAIEVLARRGLTFSRIIAASSGALNGTYLAAAVCSGRLDEAADKLGALWRNHADWRSVFQLDLGALARARGLSSSEKLIELMRAEVGPIAEGGTHPVQLSLVVAPLRGRITRVNGRPVTTYESVETFKCHHFTDETARERIYRAAAASAAFPVVFEPVELEGLGPCYDGGVVNDVPVKMAVDDGAERVVVVAPYPEIVSTDVSLSGFAGLSHLADILIHERLYRDLRDAEQVNDRLEKFEELVARGQLTAEQLQLIQSVTGWKRRIEIVQIRPEQDLPGSAFAGFFDGKLREAYIEAGRRSAERALAAMRA